MSCTPAVPVNPSSAKAASAAVNSVTKASVRAAWNVKQTAGATCAQDAEPAARIVTRLPPTGTSMRRDCAQGASGKNKNRNDSNYKRRTHMNHTKTSQQPFRQSVKRQRRDDEPVLTFSPLAWLKLQYFCHAGESEIGGFGISSADDLLYIEDFVTVKQTTSMATVEFADDAVADHFDTCVDAGLKPEQFARVWIHTHPGQ